MPLNSVSDVGANELPRDEYIAMIAHGTGLSEEAVAEVQAEWSATSSLTDPLYTLPGDDGGRNYRRSDLGSNPVSRADARSAPSVALIAKEVAAAIIGEDVASDVCVEEIIAGLGQTIGAAAFGLHVSDLHSSGDEPIFQTATPKMVGELIKRVLNRAREGQHPIIPEHPAISDLRKKLTRTGRTPSASPADGRPSHPPQVRRDSGFDKEQRKQAAKDLKAAAAGRASFDVLKEAEDSRTVGRLAAMTSDDFADGLMAGTLGESGAPLDPLARTILSLSLEHIPAGFGNVSSVVEHVKYALRSHVSAQFKNGKSEHEVTATLMRKVNYDSHEAIKFLEAIRIGYCGIGVSGSNGADPRAAISEVREARLVGGSRISTTEHMMPVTALAVQLGETGRCPYRPLFGGDVVDFPADMDVLEFAKHWYDAVHGTSSGLLNFHTAVKGALRTVPFGDLKYAMFKAEYTFMIAKAKARLGRDVDQGDFYSITLTPSGAAAGPGRHVLSAVLQTLKDEAHVLLLNRQKVGEMAAEMEKHMAAQVQEQVQAHMAKLGASTPTPEVSEASASQPAFMELKRQFDTLQAGIDNLKSQRVRFDEPSGDDQEMDADELDEDAFLEDEDSLCWKHLTVKGCADGSCPFIHMDRQGMGWCPSERQTDLLRGRIQSLYDVKWDWSKIESFELDAGIFN